MLVRVSGLNDARMLSEACNLCSCDINAKTGSRVCDAKSALGILTLDLNADIELTFNCSEDELQQNIALVSENYKVG